MISNNNCDDVNLHHICFVVYLDNHINSSLASEISYVILYISNIYIRPNGCDNVNQVWPKTSPGVWPSWFGMWNSAFVTMISKTLNSLIPEHMS